MNKCALAVVITAAATLTGCLDPNYKRPVRPSEPVDIPESKVEKHDKKLAEEPKVEEKKAKDDDVVVVEEKVVEEKKPVVVEKKPEVKAPVAEETTVYYVQRGDSLSKISKKFNIRIDAIRKKNYLKGDKIRIGQKLILPGKVDVGAAANKPAPSKLAPVAKKKSSVAAKDYTGETKEYVVENGDTLGHIATRSGINSTQLKKLNGLTNDTIRVGQKLKIPASKQVAAKKGSAANVAAKTPAKPVAKVEGQAVKPEEKTSNEKVVAVSEDEDKVVGPIVADPPAVPAPAPVETVEYTVREGEDVIGIGLSNDIDPVVIRELNNLNTNDDLKPGQKIKLPVKKN
jgi:LysM repeat protein